MNKKELKENLVSFRYKVLTKLGVMEFLMPYHAVYQLLPFVTPEEQYAFLRYDIEKNDSNRHLNPLLIQHALDGKKSGYRIHDPESIVSHQSELNGLNDDEVLEALAGDEFELDDTLYLRSAQQKALDQMFTHKDKFGNRTYQGCTTTLMYKLSDEQIDALAKIAEQDFAERLECRKYKNMKEYQSETLSMALDAIILEYQSERIRARISKEYNLNDNGVGRLRTYNDEGEEISTSLF